MTRDRQDRQHDDHPDPDDGVDATFAREGGEGASQHRSLPAPAVCTMCAERMKQSLRALGRDHARRLGLAGAWRGAHLGIFAALKRIAPGRSGARGGVDCPWSNLSVGGWQDSCPAASRGAYELICADDVFRSVEGDRTLRSRIPTVLGSGPVTATAFTAPTHRPGQISRLRKADTGIPKVDWNQLLWLDFLAAG